MSGDGPEPRRRVADRYELEARLGRGGMGEVWRARDERLHRTVAIKFLGDGPGVDEEIIGRFRREARLLASLNHPNVVAVHDVDEEEGAHYLVMEYVAGPSLGDLLREEGPLVLERTAAIVDGVSRALGAAHAHGVVHRDVKPSNILLAPGGEVKLADFGIAKQLEATATGPRYGSAPYVAPEQVQGDPVDHRADIYGLACVVYEMLTGQPPFTADGPAAIVYQHVHATPAPVTELRPELPPDVDGVLGRALAKEPGDRFQSIEAFRRGLEEVAGGAGATQLLSDATTVAVGSPAGGRGAPPTDEPTSERNGARAEDQDGQEEVVVHAASRRSRVGAIAAFGALVVIAVLGLIAATTLGNGGDEPPQDAPAEDPGPGSEEQGPAEEPAPEEAEPPSVEEAATSFIQTVFQGRSEGGISEDAAKELGDSGEKILEKVREGKFRDADKEIRETRKELDELQADGEVDPRWAERLHGALDDLERALGVQRPADESDDDDEDDDDDPPRGRGRGDD